MKKLFAIVLAMTMIFALSANAFAADTIESIEAPANVSTGEVAVTVTEGINNKIVYSVTVEWTDTSMEYQEEGEGTWDPTTHSYLGATEAGWTDNEAAVTVTNHSNADVVATIAEGTNVTGTTYAFSQESFILATAVGKDLNAAANNTFEITGSGVPTEAGNDSFTVTITGAPQEIVLTLPDDFTAFQNKNESVIVTLPDGMTYNDVTYSMQNGAGAACKMTVEPGERENELVVNHGGICGGDGSSTLIVTSKSNPNCTGSLVIRCNV